MQTNQQLFSYGQISTHDDFTFEYSFSHFIVLDIRLQGPLSFKGIGRVEVFYNGQWGTVYDDGWDLNDAKVVCRQLGYQNAIRALGQGQVEEGTGQIWLNFVACTGSERNLSSCSHRGWGRHDCSQFEDAGVECSSPSNFLYFLPL